MSNKINDGIYEDMRERREQWLEENDYNESDIMEDIDGEYVMTTVEQGTAGDDDYEVKRVKMYLPDNCQESWIFKMPTS